MCAASASASALWRIWAIRARVFILWWLAFCHWQKAKAGSMDCRDRLRGRGPKFKSCNAHHLHWPLTCDYKVRGFAIQGMYPKFCETASGVVGRQSCCSVIVQLKTSGHKRVKVFMDAYVWSKVLARKLQAVFGNRVVFVGLQGSRARGEAREDSDIDAVVLLDVVTADYLHAAGATVGPHGRASPHKIRARKAARRR